MPDSLEDSDPKLQSCLAALAHGCEEASFDVTRLREPHSLRLLASFHQRSEAYALVRKATLWAAETHEYLLAYSPARLDICGWEAIRKDALARGLAAVQPHTEHMVSYISIVLFCHHWHREAAGAVQKTRFVKSFLWGLRGWTRLRTLAVCLPLSEQEPALCVCNASARTTLLPLVRQTLSPLFTLQEFHS